MKRLIAIDYNDLYEYIRSLSQKDLLTVAREITNHVGDKYFDFCIVDKFDENTINIVFANETPYSMFNKGVTSSNVNFSDEWFRVDSGGHIETVSERRLESEAAQNVSEIEEAVADIGNEIDFSDSKLNELVTQLQ